MAKDTTLIRVDTEIAGGVRKVITKTKQSLGGYYDLAAKEKLARDNKKLKAGKNPAV